jgi:hypothetical protein
MSIDIKNRLQGWLTDFPGQTPATDQPVYPLLRDALAEIMALEARNEYCHGRLADLQAKYDLALETLARMNTLAAGG